SDRLGIQGDSLLVVAETDLDRILSHLESVRPDFVVLDSIQMVARTELPGAPGSIAQVRDCATELVRVAKAGGCTLALIGHVTKDGAIAGPRLLEHLVDVVLYFEGSGDRSYRLLRGVKNRFGPTEEIGVFEMRGEGLVEVENTAAIFLPHGDRPMPPGTVVVPVLEGSRILLVEIQALVARAAYGPPRIKVTGVESNRVAMLLAVIEKRVGLQIADQDVHVNVVGGLRIREPAADLGIALACMSSFVDRPVRPRTVVLGEVGLGGEVRSVQRTAGRLKEAAQLGFERALLPGAPKDRIEAPEGLILDRIEELRAALEVAVG
ncbi:MAG: magnesium chelatase domain-containing protein, partial [Planctomycetota bacterium]